MWIFHQVNPEWDGNSHIRTGSLADAIITSQMRHTSQRASLMLASETMTTRGSHSPVTLDVSGDVGIITISNPPVNALAIPGASAYPALLLFSAAASRGCPDSLPFSDLRPHPSHFAVLRGLKEKFEAAQADSRVKAIVVTGSKGKFSGGFDITQLRARTEGNPWRTCRT